MVRDLRAHPQLPPSNLPEDGSRALTRPVAADAAGETSERSDCDPRAADAGLGLLRVLAREHIARRRA